MATEIITGARTLRGTVRVPGDKSISHRALMLSALAEGSCRITGIATGKDVASTAHCLRGLGVAVDPLEPAGCTVPGAGSGGLKQLAGVLDAGNSGTTMRLLSGILAGQNFTSSLTGDIYLCRRPMKRIIEPLERMGARVESAEGGLPP
ncbi:MAG: 3-phosphoshikimate 1-carboxyvinyltransferase, partial [Candidatus Glassbacteria bacterium]